MLKISHSFTRHFSLLLVFICLSIGSAYSQVLIAPSSCTAAIGTPASGSSHYINVSWAAVSGADSYLLQYSTDGSTWVTLSTGDSTTFAHNTGSIGNLPYYYRVNAASSGGPSSAYTKCSTYPIYSACNDTTPVLSNAAGTSLTLAIQTAAPDSNGAGATYAIYCTTTSQYVQANGTLGANAVYQSKAAWGSSITVSGLTASTNYCFYVAAENNNGNIQILSGSSALLTQTFDATSSVSTSNSAPTNAWWTPPDPTSYPARLTWLSTGGCSGGTGAGNVGYSGSFNNYFGSFLRSPSVNCSGLSSITLTFDLTNSYIPADSSGNYIMFYEADAAFSVGYTNATAVNGVSGYELYFDKARNCQEVTVTFNLTAYPSTKNAMLFYLAPQCGYNDPNVYSVNMDNVTFASVSNATACLSTIACATAKITTNPTNENVCAGSNTIFSVSTSGSVASYQWQVSTNSGGSWTNINNGGIYSTATTATLNLSAVTSIYNGYEYRCMVTGSCSGTPISTAATLTLIDTPNTPGSITGQATVCSGTSNTYSVVAVNGATSYTWTLPSGWTGSSTSNSIDATASATAGNITVTANSMCGNSAPQTQAIAVNTAPAEPGTISGSASICSGSSNTYSVVAVAGATSYTWVLPSGWSGSSSTNSINASASMNGGNITVTANNACGNSSAQSLAISITPAPSTPGSISGPTSICSGTANTYSVSAVNGATSYTWTLPSGWTGSSITNSIDATASATAGNITVTANNSCGNSSAQTLTVTINTAPATPGSISGSVSICSGSTNMYSVAPVNNATSYTWTLPSGWSGSSATNSIEATANTTAGTITVTANNTCGNSSAQTLAVSINSAPATPGSISGTTAVCSGASNTYSVTAVAGATSYNWSLPSGWSGSSSSNSISATASANAGSITVTAGNTCGISAPQTLGVTVNTAPATPGPITGTTTICSGTSNIYSISSVSNTTSYTWTLPSGWSGTSATTSISATASGSGGNIMVTADNSCGKSSFQTLAIVVNTAPATPTIVNGPTSICSGTTNTYSVPAVSGATSYTWALPSGWTGTSATDSISTNASTRGGDILVTAKNSCGISSSQSLAVAVTAAPVAGTITSSTDSICQGTLVSLTLTGNSGGSIQWQFATSGSYSNITGATTATYEKILNQNTAFRVIATSNTCTDTSATKTITVNTPPVAAFSDVVNGLSVTFNSGNSTGATGYSWNFGDGSPSSTETNPVHAFTTPGTYNVCLTVSNKSNCNNILCQNITVSATPPVAGFTANTTAICAGGTVSFNNISSSATTYQWYFTGGSPDTSTLANPTAVTYNTPGNYTVELIATSGDQHDTLTKNNYINVTALPQAGTITAPKDSVCDSTAATLTVSGSTGNIQWQSSAINGNFTNISGATKTTYTTAPLTQVTYFRVYSNSGNCSDTSGVYKVSIHINPTASFTYNISGNTVTFNSAGSIDVATFYWSFGDGMNSPDANPVHVYSTNSTFNVCLTVTNTNGCSSSYCTEVVESSTGINNVTGTDGWQVYPNPFGDYIILQGSAKENTDVVITDVLGRELARTIISAGATESRINMPVNTASGIYFINLISADGTMVQKKLMKVE